jgi:hypothetical protein
MGYNSPKPEYPPLTTKQAAVEMVPAMNTKKITLNH